MAISFLTVDASILTPGQFTELNPDRNSNPQRAYRLLIVGHAEEALAVTAEPSQMLSADQGFVDFGDKGTIGHMVKRAFENNSNAEVWALPMTETAGVAATHSVTFVGTATGSGQLFFKYGSREVKVDVAIGDDFTAIAVSFNDALNDDARAYGTSANTLGVSTVTTNSKGAYGGNIPLRYVASRSVLPAGVTAPVVVNEVIAGTDSDVDMDAVVAALGDKQWHNLAIDLNSGAEVLKMETELDSRYGGMDQRDGRAFYGILGDASTLVTYTDTRNSQFSLVVPTSDSDTPEFDAAAIMAAINSNQSVLDPARPRTGRRMVGMNAPITEAGKFDRATRQTLLAAGVGTWIAQDDGSVTVERIVTTQTERNGVGDFTFLDVTTPETLSFMRFDWGATLASKYPNYKLGDDDGNYNPGQAIVTPNTIRAEAIAINQKWERDGLSENAASFEELLIVERSSTDPNRLDIILAPDLINQFRVAASRIDFVL